MTEQVISEVLSRWDLIADGLMALSPKVYEIYVRQAFWVKGVKGTIAGSLFSTILRFCVVLFIIACWEDQDVFGVRFGNGLVSLIF